MAWLNGRVPSLHKLTAIAKTLRRILCQRLEERIPLPSRKFAQLWRFLEVIHHQPGKMVGWEQGPAQVQLYIRRRQAVLVRVLVDLARPDLGRHVVGRSRA